KASQTERDAYASLATTGPSRSINKPTGYALLIARTSRRTAATAVGLMSLASRSNSQVAGSVLTTGIGFPAESSEIERNGRAAVSARVVASTLVQYARSLAGSQ